MESKPKLSDSQLCSYILVQQQELHVSLFRIPLRLSFQCQFQVQLRLGVFLCHWCNFAVLINLQGSARCWMESQILNTRIWLKKVVYLFQNRNLHF